MTTGERIKEVRKSLNLTLEKFGDRLGVGKTAISNIEKGNRNLTEHMRKSICREFNVDPIWLSTGEGEMFIEQSLDSIEMLDKLLHTESKFANAMFKMFTKYTKEDWEALEHIVSKSAEYIKELEDKQE